MMNPLAPYMAILRVVGYVLAAAGVAFAVWWIFIHPGQLGDQVAKTQAENAILKGDVAAVKEAQPIILRSENTTRLIDERTKAGNDDIQAAPIDGIADAGRRAVCMHTSLYSDDAVCVGLRQSPAS